MTTPSNGNDKEQKHNVLPETRNIKEGEPSRNIQRKNDHHFNNQKDKKQGGGGGGKGKWNELNDGSM
eukprot:CAMPEP_0113481366 /NCGR_PEP_ID=MMETSP0014_2-20120614/22371_1 /TAXON_ID=2857 /ORGANISM="Nitzschia sp." /LENGTH=66 /DNA_ID=CAMNT_0000374859 /DNA_START=89 /DNA_END=289 /DNA_ORIENTATION=- /assembly_acc=CAM_ASM_000159